MPYKSKFERQQERDPHVVHAAELRDAGLDDLNKWPGYFMRKFDLSYKAAEELADQMARYAEIGKYARPKKVKREVKHERDSD